MKYLIPLFLVIALYVSVAINLQLLAEVEEYHNIVCATDYAINHVISDDPILIRLQLINDTSHICRGYIHPYAIPHSQ